MTEKVKQLRLGLHVTHTSTKTKKRCLDTTEKKSLTREVIELPLEFEHKSGNTPFKFRQIAKTEKGYIYEVNDEGVIHYEVFKWKVRKKENRVRYPGANDFGYWAWTYRDKEKAYKKLQELESSPKNDE